MAIRYVTQAILILLYLQMGVTIFTVVPLVLAILY